MSTCQDCGYIISKIIDKNGKATYECSNPNCPSKKKIKITVGLIYLPV